MVGEISLTTSLRSSIPSPEEAINVLRYTFSASGSPIGSSGLGFLCPPRSLAPGVKGAKLVDGIGESSGDLVELQNMLFLFALTVMFMCGKHPPQSRNSNSE